MDISTAWKPWRKALSIQRQTLSALIFRETKTRFGEESLGILWAFGEVLTHIFVMWAFWTLFRHTGHDGLSVPVFLLTGLLPFFMFRSCFEKTSNCISGNQSLLVFSQIHILDFALARCILEITIYISAFFIFLMFLYFFEYEFTLYALPKILTGFLITFILGLGMGLLYLPFKGKFKIIEAVVPLFMRAIYILSGAIFPLERFPHQVLVYLEYNPLFHIINYIRTGFVPDYSIFKNILYGFEFSIFVFMIGLILIKRLRRMILDND
jgi:capsular polysaccharide transport system permease protein